MMFVETIKRVHPDLSEQSVSQLREFLVTAQQRQQSDSQVLLIGLQALRQEVLDEGFDWSDLITNLIDLICADLHEDQHKRFVADLDRLYSSNASLSEVRYVMASDYPSTLNVLQLLIQEAHKEHEALTATAGGTSSWRRDPSRTDKGRKVARTKDVAEALYLGVAVTGGIVGVSNYRKAAALERAGVKDLQAKYEDQNWRFSDGERGKTVRQISPRHVKHTNFDGDDHYRFDDLQDLQNGYKSISTEFDFKGYAKLDRMDKTPHELRELMRKDANILLDRINNGDNVLSVEEREMTKGLEKSDYGTVTRDLNIKKLMNHPEFNDYYDNLRGIDKYQEFTNKFSCLNDIDDYIRSDSYLNDIDDYIRSEGAKAFDFKYKKYWNQDQYNEHVKGAKYDELIDNANAAGVNPNQLDREAENEVSLDGGNVKKMMDEELSPSTWQEVSTTDGPRMNEVRKKAMREIKMHYKAQIEEFVRANPYATERDLKPATKALLDPDKQIDPDDVDDDSPVSRVMNDDSRLINTNVNFRKAERETRRALNNDGLRIQPDDKIGGQNDAGRLDNNGGIDSLLEAPQKAAGKIETGVDEQIEEVVPQVEEQAMSEIGSAVEKETVQTVESVDEALETAGEDIV